MEESILLTIRKLLEDNSENFYDENIIIGINTALMELNQIGIGPDTGFMITGEGETWTDLIGEYKDVASVKTYVHLKTKLLFDPPGTSFALEAMERILDRLEWRLNSQVEVGRSSTV